MVTGRMEIGIRVADCIGCEGLTRGQNLDMSNQWAAVAAVNRSTLPGLSSDARSGPGRSSAVELAKVMGGGEGSPAVGLVVRVARAALSISTEGSTPKARAKCGAKERVAVPGPQPTSRRVVSWPPVAVWWVRMTRVRASG